MGLSFSHWQPSCSTSKACGIATALAPLQLMVTWVWISISMVGTLNCLLQMKSKKAKQTMRDHTQKLYKKHTNVKPIYWHAMPCRHTRHDTVEPNFNMILWNQILQCQVANPGNMRLSTSFLVLKKQKKILFYNKAKMT